MRILGAHINPGPRPDGGPKPFKAENIGITLDWHDKTQTYVLRVTDKANVEFHLDVFIPEMDFDAAKSKAKAKS